MTVVFHIYATYSLIIIELIRLSWARGGPDGDSGTGVELVGGIGVRRADGLSQPPLSPGGVEEITCSAAAGAAKPAAGGTWFLRV